ncbi:hypothetical protein PCANC_18293, partial [Puccinia coronata f. sp. avenae]
MGNRRVTTEDDVDDANSNPPPPGLLQRVARVSSSHKPRQERSSREAPANGEISQEKSYSSIKNHRSPSRRQK